MKAKTQSDKEQMSKTSTIKEGDESSQKNAEKDKLKGGCGC